MLYIHITKYGGGWHSLQLYTSNWSYLHAPSIELHGIGVIII